MLAHPTTDVATCWGVAFCLHADVVYYGGAFSHGMLLAVHMSVISLLLVVRRRHI
jgi:hypothetical protein